MAKKKRIGPADPAVRAVGGARVRLVPVPNPVPMITLGPEHGVWSGGALPDVRGALVRVLPPAQATDEEIGRVLGDLRNLGVAGLALLPRMAGGVVALPAETIRPVRRRHREVVLDMVAQSAGVDRDALAACVAAVMDEEGL